jgi:hypothetical protein
MGMFATDDGTYDIDEDFIYTYLDDIIKDRSQVRLQSITSNSTSNSNQWNSIRSPIDPSDCG